MMHSLSTLYTWIKTCALPRAGLIGMAGLLFLVVAMPAFAAAPIAPRSSEAEGKVLATYNYSLSSVKMSYKASPSNFFRISKETPKTFDFEVTLESPDIIEFDADTYFSEYDVESLDLIAVHSNNLPGACSTAPAYDECNSSFAYEVGSQGRGERWTKGQTRTFRVTMTADLMQKLTMSSSATGKVHKISFIPRFDYELTVIGREPDESDFVPGLSVFFQVYDTQAQADAAAGEAPPSEVNGPNEGSSSGAEVCEDLPCYIGQMIAAIATLFNELIGWVVAYILGPLIEALLSIRTFDAKFADVIYKAWLIFRNLGNIFFILAIVAIGVATVFRISGYAVKDLLVKLIIGAILINFSLVIAQVILGIADTVQNAFLPNNTGAIRLIAEALIKTDIFKTTSASDFGQFGTAVRTIVSLWLAFAAFVAFIGVAFLLLVRIVFLWLLLMTSPLPYIAMVLPVSRSMSKKWWNSFFKWAFITPAVAFMLNLTALIARESQNTFSNLVTVHNLTGTTETILFAVGANFLPLVFMYMTLQVATMFGKGTAGFVDKAIDKGVKGALWPGAAVAGYAAGASKSIGKGAAAVAKSPITLAGVGLKKANQEKQKFFADRAERGGVVAKAAQIAFSPIQAGKAIGSAWKESANDRKKAAEYAHDVAGASITNTPGLGKLFGHKVFNDKVDLRRAKEEKEFGANITHDPAGSLQGFNKAVKDKDSTKVAAYIMKFAEASELNDLLGKSDLGTFSNNLKGKIDFIDSLVKKGVLNESTAARLHSQISSEAKKQGDLHFIGGTTVKDGRLVRITKEGTDLPSSAAASGQTAAEFLKAQKASGVKLEQEQEDFIKQADKYAEKVKDLGAGGRARSTKPDMILDQNNDYKDEHMDWMVHMSEADFNATSQVDDKRRRKEIEVFFDSKLVDSTNPAAGTVGDQRRKRAVDSLANAFIDDAKKDGITLSAGDAQNKAEERYTEYLRRYLRVTRSGTDIDLPDLDMYATLTRESGEFNQALKGIANADRQRIKDYINDIGQNPDKLAAGVPADIDSLLNGKGVDVQTVLTDKISTNISKRFTPRNFGMTRNLTAADSDAIKSQIEGAIITAAGAAPSGKTLKDQSAVIKSQLQSRLSGIAGLSGAEIDEISRRVSEQI